MWATRARKVILALTVFSMLFWAYVSARLVFSQPGWVQPAHYFIDAFPSFLGIELTFLNVGIITFVLGFIFFLAYLLLEEPERAELYHCHECEAEAFIFLEQQSEELQLEMKRDGHGKEIG